MRVPDRKAKQQTRDRLGKFASECKNARTVAVGRSAPPRIRDRSTTRGWGGRGRGVIWGDRVYTSSEGEISIQIKNHQIVPTTFSDSQGVRAGTSQNPREKNKCRRRREGRCAERGVGGGAGEGDVRQRGREGCGRGDGECDGIVW